MKAIIPLLIVSTSALAVTTVQFAHRAGTERQRADEAQAIVLKSDARIRELETAHSALEQRVAQSQPAIPATAESASAPLTRAVPAPAMKTLTPPRQPAMGFLARADATAGGGSTARSGAPMPWFGPAVQMSPAGQRAMRWQMKTSLRRQYDDVGVVVGLSQEQTNKLVDLIADQQTRSMEDMRKPSAGSKDPMQAMQDWKKRNDAEIAALIGPDKVTAWQDYQRSLPERSQVNMIRDQMQNLGAPITDDQRSRLLDIVTEEHQRNPPPVVQTGLAPEDQIAQSIKYQEESERALLDRARSVLTSEQYERYRDYQEWQIEMRKGAQMRFRAAMPQPGGAMVNGLSAIAIAPAPDPAQK